MHRHIPITELLPLINTALENIKRCRQISYEYAVDEKVKWVNKKRQRSWLVRLGLRKYKEFTREEADADLRTVKEMFAPSEHEKITTWWFDRTEEDLERLKNLCLIAKEREDVVVDGTTGTQLYNWVNYNGKPRR